MNRVTGPNVVVAVGGGGSAICENIQDAFPFGTRLDVIVPTGDSGGSSGELRDVFDVPAVGDVRKALVAVSADKSVADILNTPRFGSEAGIDGIAHLNERLLGALAVKGIYTDVADAVVKAGQELQERSAKGLRGHPYGNLVLAALCRQQPITEVAQDVGQWVNARGRVLPSTPQRYQMIMQDDAQEVRGEKAIDEYPVFDPETARIWLESDESPYAPVTITNEVFEGIAKADALVFGPGSPITSRGQLLAHNGFAEAVAKQQGTGPMVLVANPVREQTTPTLGLESTVNLLYNATDGRAPDHIVCDPALLRPEDANYLRRSGINAIHADLVDGTTTQKDPNDPIERSTVQYNSTTLGAVLWDIISADSGVPPLEHV